MTGSASSSGEASAIDRRLMAAAIRYARRHVALTGTNPSVATLVVRDNGHGPVIVGRGVTARGGRPHAETLALAEAGSHARGATAYVTLEPCAHHGRTPPCAEALVVAGIARVVTAAADPDPRVCGRGHAILRRAGIEVLEGLMSDLAFEDLAGYLVRTIRKRPHVSLKLAVSADGMIGRRDGGQIAITGPVSRGQVHVMRSQSDAILIGIGTALEDDPTLTCRLPGLEDRSPIRIVLDRDLRLPADSKLARTAGKVPVWIAARADPDPERRAVLAAAGCRILATEMHEGRIALPELLDDLAAEGLSRVMVEGGAATAAAFLAEGLVDQIGIFEGPIEIGREAGVAAPDLAPYLADFFVAGMASFGEDRYTEYLRPLKV